MSAKANYSVAHSLSVANGEGGPAVRPQPGFPNRILPDPFFMQQLSFFNLRDSIGRPRLAAFRACEHQ